MSSVPGADVPMEKPAKKSRKGRVGQDKQEAVIKLEFVKDRSADLILLYHEQVTAATDFSEAIKTTAEQAGLNAAVVRRFIIAKAGEHYAEAKRTVTQLNLVFDIE